MTLNAKVRLCCLSGLAGSLLFLAGDMTWYGSFSSAAAFHSFQVMAQRSDAVLVAGGAVGPIAALCSACGMAIFYFTLEPASAKLARASAALLAMTILIGGSYHALFAVFGFAQKIGDASLRQTLLSQVALLRNTVGYAMYATGLSGIALVYWLALTRKTHFPRWLLLFTPILSQAGWLLDSWFRQIPAPLGSIVVGGWINGTFVLFFALAMGAFWRLGRAPAAIDLAAEHAAPAV